MREGVERQPDRAEMRFAAGLILESLGERGAALSQVESVPERERSDGMRALAARMRFERCLTAAGDEPSLLSECETHAGDDPGRRARLAGESSSTRWAAVALMLITLSRLHRRYSISLMRRLRPQEMPFRRSRSTGFARSCRRRITCTITS